MGHPPGLMRVELVGTDGHVQHHAPVGGQVDVAADEIGVHVVVLLEDDRHRLCLAVQGEHRRGVVVELMPVLR